MNDLLARLAGRHAATTADRGEDRIRLVGQNDAIKAEAAARKAYEGDGQNSEGERRRKPCAGTAVADFDALLADETFAGWCEALYRPIV